MAYFPVLAILAGCSVGGARPSLDVTTLSQTSELKHPAARRVRPMAQAATAASAFVDSVGVNVHNGYYGTPYGDQPARIAKLVAQLGVHHLRDENYPGQSNICSLDQAYAAAGVYFDYIVSPAETDTQLSSWQSCSAPAAEAYEGYNEYDLSGDPNWVTVLQAAQQQVYAFGSGLGLPVVGPSLTTEGAYGAVGPVPANTGNMHDYFSGHNPGSPGWGGQDQFGVYGSLAYFIAIAQQTTGQAPMWSTETGYGDAAGSLWSVPAQTKIHYELRTLFDQWNAGVPRTYLYELVDEGGGDFGSYGLVDAKLKPKPVFRALSSLLKHLSVEDSTPASLSYALNAASSVEYTLLATRPGSFVLALWDEVPEWDPLTNQPITVYPQPVTLTFAQAPRKLSVTTFTAKGQASVQQMAPQSSVSLDVDGGVSLVDITP
jgi:hypothetical protein